MSSNANVLWLFVFLVIFHFGFEGKTLVLLATVPGFAYILFIKYFKDIVKFEVTLSRKPSMIHPYGFS